MVKIYSITNVPYKTNSKKETEVEKAEVEKAKAEAGARWGRKAGMVTGYGEEEAKAK